MNLDIDSIYLDVFIGDCVDSMKRMESNSIQTCITSPPYFGLRDYEVNGQIGLELTPTEYVTRLVEVFREVKRILRDDGTLWLNLGDSYAGSHKGGNPADSPHRKQATNSGSLGGRPIGTFDGIKAKDLIGIPWRVAFALQEDGWYLRQDIIWHKPNPMPESVRDRCTKAHEYIFLLSKNKKYYFDVDSIKEDSKYPTKSGREQSGKYLDLAGRTDNMNHLSGGFKTSDKRNKRSVWSVVNTPYASAHTATFPPTLIEPCVLAGSRKGDIVFDPFGGTGTTAGVAIKHSRKAILCELNRDYVSNMSHRISGITGIPEENVKSHMNIKE